MTALEVGGRARRARVTWIRAVLVPLVVSVGLAAPARGAESRAVAFAARDGVTVTGVLFVPDRRPAPAVILLPMLGRTFVDWDATATRLAEAGVAALAIDFRRNGSGKPGPTGADSGDRTDLVNDVDGARLFLAARADILPDRIGIAGASIGANVAVLAAAADPTIRSLALLSASLDYRGLRIEPAMRTYGSRPALVLASDEDPYAVRSAHALVALGDGPRDLRLLSGAGHGTVMLSRQPDLIGVLVDWFVRTLI